MPIETANKRAGFEAVAKALERGDLALAQIAALLLQFPAPPLLAKAERADRDALAVELMRSGLLKGDWDPDKHPPTGTPPNPGWFAPRDHEVEPARNDNGDTTVFASYADATKKKAMAVVWQYSYPAYCQVRTVPTTAI